ncbi:hypothetical protein BGZ51_006175 [Haplosporangium sp. Z 767]|nr:hypothetical protein BGZ51_006175 [Haplosporangium sp. Z 767]
MKTTTSGRAFAKNIFDLFSTLMISLPIENHKVLFKSYPNSFIAEDAISNLGGLQFIQSNHDTDPKDPTRIITRVVTTQFSLNREMAKNLCQTFMDARLFECATDTGKREFHNKGIYQVTGKGAHIVEKFVHRNGLSIEATRHITANATPRILVLERAEDEDAILLHQMAVDAVFKRFAGPKPNVAQRSMDMANGADGPPISSSGRDRHHSNHHQSNVDRCNGIEVKDQQHNYDVYKHTFYGKVAVDWLMDFTTVISKEEAICIAQEMVNARYIEQVGEERRSDMQLFKTGNSALYHFTDTGRAVVGWEDHVRSRVSSTNTDWMDERGPINGRLERNNPEMLLSAQFKLTSSTIPRLPISVMREGRRSEDDASVCSSSHFNEDATTMSGGSVRRLSQILNDPTFQVLSDGAMSSYAASSSGKDSVSGPRESGPPTSVVTGMISPTHATTTSNTTRLNLILSDATLRDLFKTFLKQNICEENLAFCLEVQDYQSKFNTLINSTLAYSQSVSSGLDNPSPSSGTASLTASTGTVGAAAAPQPASLRELEKQICTQAFAIHETYLVSGAPRELNLPHQMRMDITAYMQAVVRNMESGFVKAATKASSSSSSSSSSPVLDTIHKPLPSTPSSPSAVANGNHVGESNGAAGYSKELIHITLFDPIREHIFRLMSTDSVPKFTRTNMYREAMMKRVKKRDPNPNNSLLSNINGMNHSNNNVNLIGGMGHASNGMQTPTSLDSHPVAAAPGV